MGRETQPSLFLVDAQSVKNSDTTREKGYDGGKKVSGIKQHIACGHQRPAPCGTRYHGGRHQPRVGALETFTLRKDSLSLVEKVLVDGGYTGEVFAASVKTLLGAEIEAAKRSKLHNLTPLPSSPSARGRHCLACAVSPKIGNKF
jgi:hypothetical protein